MDVNNVISVKEGDCMRKPEEAPSNLGGPKQKLEGNIKKKRRRGKFKRKIVKPKVSWQDRRNNDKSKRNNRLRKIVIGETHAPFNNNQFLMEIHKPEPENNFHMSQTPSARTRDSSFSVDSEENYFYSLPEDEEEYLTKEFSSVYEDAQSERLSNMSKDDLIQEYLLLEAKYESLVKRTERSKQKTIDDEKDVTDKETSVSDKDVSETSVGSNMAEMPCISDMVQQMKEQEDQIHNLMLENEKLREENEHLLKKSQDSTSEDSESDSSSTSISCSSSNSSRIGSPIVQVAAEVNDNTMENNIVQVNGQNGDIVDDLGSAPPLVNGFHSPDKY